VGARLADRLDGGRRTAGVRPEARTTKERGKIRFQILNEPLWCPLGLLGRLRGPYRAANGHEGCSMGFLVWEDFLAGEADGSFRIPYAAPHTPVCRRVPVLPHRRRVGLRRRRLSVELGDRAHLRRAGPVDLCCLRDRSWRRDPGLARGSGSAAAVASAGRRRADGTCSGMRDQCVAAVTGKWRGMLCREEVGKTLL
jgi:hypothetical protein